MRWTSFFGSPVSFASSGPRSGAVRMIHLPSTLITFTPRNSPLFRNADGDTDLSFGYKGGAGLAVYIFRNLMVFGEYRYTHAHVSADLRDALTRNASIDTDLNTHSFLVGISARW